MASRTETQRALSVSLKLLQPSDKIDDGDASELTNFRSDKINELRTRKGSTLECTVDGGDGPFHTLRKVGVYRLAGIGTKLFGGAVPTGLFADKLDGQPLGMAFYQSVPIVPYSGETSQGVAWIMNRARQLRLSQTEAFKWGVDAPTTAPTSVSSGATVVSLEQFDSGGNVQAQVDGVNWLDALIAGAPADNPICEASFSSDISVDFTESLQLVVSGPASVQFTTDPGVIDTTVEGGVRDDDEFYIAIYLTDPTRISSFAVQLTDSNGAIVSVPFVPNTSLDPAKILNQNPNSWTNLAIRRQVNVDSFMAQIDAAKQLALAGNQQQTQIASDLSAQLALFLQQAYFNIVAGRDPATIGITTPLRKGVVFDWTQVASMQINFVCSDAVQINLDACNFTGVDGVALTGQGQYYVTFFNEVLQEGNPSPPSDPLIVTNGAVTLNDIPVWVASGYNPNTYGGQKSAQVRGRNIYRIGFGLSQPLQVGTIWDNTTTTWIDPYTNQQAQADGIVMAIDHNLPPPARGCLGPFLGRIIAFNTDAHPARYFWTPVGLPWYFPGSDDDAVGNWEDAGGDDDHIVNGTDHKQLFILYKQRSIWRVVGDPDTADAQRTNSNIGLVGPNAVANAGSLDYFGGAEGVYSFNFDVETKISVDLDPIFKGDYTLLSKGDFNDIIPPINRAAMDTCTLNVVGNDRLRYCYPEIGSASPNVVLLYHIPTGRWSREKYTNVGAFTAMNEDGPGLLMAGVGSDLHRIEQDGVTTDSAGPIHIVWQSRCFDQGLPDFFKHYSDIEIEYQTTTKAGQQPASQLIVSLVYNNSVSIAVGFLQSTTRRTDIFPLQSILATYQNAQDEGLLAKNLAIRVEGDVNTECVIYGAFIHHYAEERLALSFDTGFTDFGMPEKVKQVDWFEYYESSTGGLQARSFYSDLPGRILTQRLTENVAVPTGRGTIKQRLANVIEGRNFRWTFGPSTGPSYPVPFQMHAIRARMRPIGEYIDGTNGEYFESPEFSIAPGRVGELKDFLLDYDVSGPGGLLVLYTDLAGAALTIRRTMAIPYQTTGRNIYVFPFESVGDSISDFLPNGQLFKVRLYPPPGGILRLHGRAVFRGRVIGEYFNGANGEIFQTQPIDLCGGMGLFRELSMIAGSPGTITVTLETQLEGGYDMQTAAVLVSPVTRTPAFFRLPGNTKGILQRVTVQSTDVCRLWEVKLLARKLQLIGGAWEWLPIPMNPTPDSFAEIAMPCGQTPADFEWIEIPVDAIE